MVFWRAKDRGDAVALDGASVLSFGAWSRSGRPTNATVGDGDFRLVAARVRAGWLVAGESLAEAEHVEAVVGRAEVVVGPTLVVAMFFGALGIGLMASRPVERARRRQLEFTGTRRTNCARRLRLLRPRSAWLWARPATAPVTGPRWLGSGLRATG